MLSSAGRLRRKSREQTMCVTWKLNQDVELG